LIFFLLVGVEIEEIILIFFLLVGVEIRRYYFDFLPLGWRGDKKKLF